MQNCRLKPGENCRHETRPLHVIGQQAQSACHQRTALTFDWLRYACFFFTLKLFAHNKKKTIGEMSSV